MFKGFPPMTPPTSPAPKTWGIGHSVAVATALAIGTAGGAVGTNQLTAPADPQKLSAPAAVPKTPPADPAPYEIELRAAWDLEDGPANVRRKRLILLYRRTIAAASAKSHGDLKAVFLANEKQLDMQGQLPFVRAAVLKNWPLPMATTATEITTDDRAKIVAFLTQTIAILEKLS